VLQLRSRDEVACADAGWLKAKHHFAFGPDGNPAHKPVGNLIVLNHDEIAPHALRASSSRNLEIVPTSTTEPSRAATTKETWEQSMPETCRR
jgi:hypothetical protein